MEVQWQAFENGSRNNVTGTLSFTYTSRRSKQLQEATPLTAVIPSGSSALVIDSSAPTVQSVSSSSTDGGDTITINVVFSEAVTVNTTGGTPFPPIRSAHPEALSLLHTP